MTTQCQGFLPVLKPSKLHKMFEKVEIGKFTNVSILIWVAALLSVVCVV